MLPRYVPRYIRVIQSNSPASGFIQVTDTTAKPNVNYFAKTFRQCYIMQSHRKILAIQHGRQARYVSTTTVQGRTSVQRWPIGNYAKTRLERFLLWLRGQQLQHYGPKAHIPQLFQRWDMPFFALENGTLRIRTSPPMFHHNLLDAAARVGALEGRIGYTFKDKMLCIQALKVTGAYSPLYFDGVVHEVDRNNRLALLGDRLLSLVVCEIWYQTEHSTSMWVALSRFVGS
jgi:hypothetical protein